MKYLAQKPEQYSWYLIADDDTGIRMSRLLRLLSLYDPVEPLMLGERYGFGLGLPYGYGYITGGGGMVLSRAGLLAIAVRNN